MLRNSPRHGSDREIFLWWQTRKVMVFVALEELLDYLAHNEDAQRRKRHSHFNLFIPGGVEFRLHGRCFSDPLVALLNNDTKIG